METIVFKTNMKCSGCIEKLTPALNELAGKDHWIVDLTNPDKTLTVSAAGVQAKDIQSAMEKAGFKAERLAARLILK
jgi:copper chaperone